MKRCPNGSRRNKKTRECEPIEPSPIIGVATSFSSSPVTMKKKRCPKGTRKNKKTGECDPTKKKEKVVKKLINKKQVAPKAQSPSKKMNIASIKVNVTTFYENDGYAIETVEFKGADGIDVVFDWSGLDMDKVMFVRKNGIATETELFSEKGGFKNVNQFLKANGFAELPSSINETMEIKIMHDFPSYGVDDELYNIEQGIYGIIRDGYNTRLDENDPENKKVVVRDINSILANSL